MSIVRLTCQSCRSPLASWERAAVRLPERSLEAKRARGFGQREQVVALAARYRIPAIYYLCEFVEAGGRMTLQLVINPKAADALGIKMSSAGTCGRGIKRECRHARYNAALGV